MKDGCTKASHLVSETKPAAGNSFSKLSRQLLLIDREEKGKTTSVQVSQSHLHKGQKEFSSKEKTEKEKEKKQKK